MYVPPKALMCSRVEVKVKVLQGVKATLACTLMQAILY